MQTQIMTEELKAVGALAPVAQSAGTFLGASFQRSYQNEIYQAAVLIANIGATTGGPTSFTVTMSLQDSADNSAFADYTQPSWEAGANVVGTAAGLIQLAVDLRGARQYLKVKVVVAFVGGASPTVLVDALILAGRPAVRPASAY